MTWWFNILSVAFGLSAAVFWFVSAYGKLPPMITYWDRTPERDPFYVAVKFSAKMNRVAALLSGLAVLFSALAEIVTKSV